MFIAGLDILSRKGYPVGIFNLCIQRNIFPCRDPPFVYYLGFFIIVFQPKTSIFSKWALLLIVARRYSVLFNLYRVYGRVEIKVRPKDIARIAIGAPNGINE